MKYKFLGVLGPFLSYFTTDLRQLQEITMDSLETK